MVFSFFCGPKQVLAQTSDDDDDKRVGCLEEQSATTFDTLETDDSDGTLEKDSNGPRPIRGSGSLMESGDVAHVGNNSNMKELPKLAEGVDLQSGENGEDPKDPDSATEAVKGNAEGSDMPKYVDAAKSRGPNVDGTNETPPEMTDESSNGVGSSRMNTVDGKLDEASISEETDAACVKEKDYQEKNLETGSTEAGQKEEEVDVSAHLSDCVEPTPESGSADSDEPPNEGGTLKEADCPGPNIETASLDDSRDEDETGGTEKDSYPELFANETQVEVGTDIVRANEPDIEAGSTEAGATEAAVVQRTDHRERNPQQEEGKSTPETHVDCSEANAKTGSDKPPNEEENRHPKAKDVYAEPSPKTCSVDMTVSDAMEEDESDLVLTPGLDTDDAQVNNVSLNDSLYSDGTASDTIEEDDARDLSTASERSVRFADPLVTSSLEVPRINADDLDELFYTATEISEFRQQKHKGEAPSRNYDKEHCLSLVEALDRLGIASFVAGDLQKALGAFNHSLQVKTQIMTDCDAYSTSTTIHCIADVYSKKGKWIQAMDAYNAALEVIKKADDTLEDVRRSKDALEQKVDSIRRLLGIQEGPMA